jgi:glycosyltransferase involved in cell wall biosynthesis
VVVERGRPLTDRKIVFICPNLKAGGAERQWALLAPSLAERGFDVRVLTLDGQGVYFDELRARDIPIACAHLRHRADPIGLARAVRFAGSGSSAVLTRGVSAHLVGHVVARRQRAAHVVTEHLGEDPLGMRELRPHQKLLLGPMRPRASAVVAVAPSQTGQLVRDGYRPEAIRVIPSGVADTPPLRDREALRAEIGMEPGAFLAVLVAALRPEKRAAVFVEQVAAAHAVEASIHGVVVGDGPDGASVARAVRKSGGAVRMLGYRADAVDIMHAGDVVCLTSAVEALPLSVLEAMSVGRPVLATRVGGLPEVVEDGITGFLVEPGNIDELRERLAQVLGDHRLAERLGRSARERFLERFTWEACAERCLSAYSELLGSRSP